MKPSFCACCLEVTTNLTPQREVSSGGIMRAVWKCFDCAGLGALAELEQYDIRDTPTRAPRAGKGNPA